MLKHYAGTHNTCRTSSQQIREDAETTPVTCNDTAPTLSLNSYNASKYLKMCNA